MAGFAEQLKELRRQRAAEASQPRVPAPVEPLGAGAFGALMGTGRSLYDQAKETATAVPQQMPQIPTPPVPGIPQFPQPEGETTAGGLARSFAGGGVRGVAAIPELVGTAMKYAEEQEQPIDPWSTPGGPVVARAVQAMLPLGKYLEAGSQAAADIVGGFIEGEGAGDTFWERVAGTVGEIIGSAGAGGAAAAPIRAGRGALAAARQAGAGRLGQGLAAAAPGALRVAATAPTAIGAGVGLELGREAELGPIGQVAMMAGGALTGKSVKSVTQGLARGGSAIRNAFRAPAPEALDYPTRSIIARGRVLRDYRKEIGQRYRDTEAAMRQSGVELSTAPLKRSFDEVWNELPRVAQVGKVRQFYRDVMSRGDDISLSELRGIQRTLNEALEGAAFSGSSPFALRGFSRAVRTSIDDAAQNLTGEGQRFAREIIDLNRAWSRISTVDDMHQIQKRLYDDILSFRGRFKRITPNRFIKTMRDKEEDIVRLIDEAYGINGREHFDNLMKIVRNIRRIPDETALRLAGVVDASRQATLDVLSAVGRISTAPIGSIRFRGRRIGEALSVALNHIADERRGIAVIRALEDPAIARTLLNSIQPGRSRMLQAAVRAGRTAIPGAAAGPEAPSVDVQIANFREE